jgi:hypothetical protein
MQHRGQRFMYSNFSGFGRDVDALRAEVVAADDEICRQPKDSVLVLVDVRGTTTSTQAVDVFRESATRTKGWVIRHAIIGVTGIQKILARAVARFSGEELVLFDDVDEAKDWLVSGGGDKGEAIRGM